MKQTCPVLLAIVATLITAQTAQAGGYDTPMLYSARHIGMGGAAVAYVSDASALFHNPAGLGHTQRFSLLGDVSLLLGRVQGSPSGAALNAESELTVAPFFLVGATARATDWLTFGVGVYPVASAGATYEYGEIQDKTKLVFFEIAPAVAFNLPGNINIGASYRITLMTLDRSAVTPEGLGAINFSLSGQNYASFRTGIQWTPIDSARDAAQDDEVDAGESGIAPAPSNEVDPADRTRLAFGFSYRHRTNVDVGADSGRALLEVQNIQSTFTLPGRLQFGVRGDCRSFGAALDVEYGLNSQNDRAAISGEVATMDGTDTLSVANVFEWSNAITLRMGGEYRFDRFAVRAGYIFDGTTANRAFPTAFGTPPAPTHVGTVGFGYDHGPWEINAAYAYRRGKTTITEDDLPSEEEIMNDPNLACTFCGQAGTYGITLHGLYVDFSYDFE